MLIPFLDIMVLVSVMGSRRDKKKRNALMSSIKKHDEVQTTGGIIGSVVELNERIEVVLRTTDEFAQLVRTGEVCDAKTLATFLRWQLAQS